MIRVVVRGRRGGKTSEMIKLTAADPDAIMIVANSPQAGWVKRQAILMGIRLRPEQIITMGQVQNGELQGHAWSPRYGVVDNADVVLEMLLGIPIGAISLNAAELDLKPVSDEEVLQPQLDYKALTPRQQERYDAQRLGRLFYPENTEEYDRVIMEGMITQAERGALKKPDRAPDLLSDTDCV